MKKIAYLGLLSGILCFTAACDNSQQSNATAETDRDSREMVEERNEDRIDENQTAIQGENKEDDAEFMSKAAESGLMEVELGRMAAQKASSPQVKQFGQQMVNDHSKANDQLKSIAQQKNVTLPTTLGEDKREKANELNQLSGNEFDQKYMDMMVRAHREDVDRFEEAAEDSEDPALKNFASTQLPVLRQHLEHAQQLNDQLKTEARDTGVLREDAGEENPIINKDSDNNQQNNQ